MPSGAIYRPFLDAVRRGFCRRRSRERVRQRARSEPATGEFVGLCKERSDWQVACLDVVGGTASAKTTSFVEYF